MPREYQFVFTGLTVAWLILVVYALTLMRREGRLKRELDRVRRMVEGSGKKS
ncbi:MAG TPA: CcmD family protein [Bryobacteraceae bacterium]|jgi:CcmD family protein